jgi:hypothetical protein
MYPALLMLHHAAPVLPSGAAVVPAATHRLTQVSVGATIALGGVLAWRWASSSA